MTPQPAPARARADPPRFQRFGAAKTLIGTAAVASVLVPAQLVLRRVSQPPAHARLPLLFHKAFARALGIQVVAHGRPARRGGVLFISNHLSWADIPVLGSRIPGAFVAKSEVDEWAGINFFAGLANTLYVERENRLSAGAQRNRIADRLAQGGDVILFPEGTSNDGVSVLPFKSSLFAVAEGPGTEGFLIQPVSVAYTRINGLPITRERLPEIAWIGDMELVPHAVEFMSLGRIRAEIQFHPPVRAADFAGRKALARHCHTVIANGYSRLMRGAH